MPIIQPGRADVHVNRPLTNIAVAWTQEQSMFIADQVFPTVPVAKQSDLYYVVDPEREGSRDEMTERAPATESDGFTFDLSTQPYYARKYSLHHDIPDEVRANADDPLSMDQITTEQLMEKVWIKREKLWVAKYFTAAAPGTTWTFAAAGVAAGSETAAGSFDPSDTGNTNNKIIYWDLPQSTPIEDVRRAKRSIQMRTGRKPNVLTLQQTVYDALIDHPDIVGRIDRGQTSGAAKANLVTLADLFEVDKIVIAGAVENTTKKNASGTAANMQYIAGKSALLTYAPPAAGLMVPSAGYTFDWTGGQHRGISRFRLELKHADRIEYTGYFGFEQVDKQAGYMFNNIVQ